ncbi:unnamed protein product [Schistosoma mattheei]|uniref:Uncharacterized protein n=1 Tax=Schistosoma mattheei TaxID=31246 RepID=A0AA85B4T9_9TREM|nr:unnamed protein product [Schistosoma mattheei]
MLLNKSKCLCTVFVCVVGKDSTFCIAVISRMILPSSVPKRKKAEKELFKDTHTIESNEIICKQKGEGRNSNCLQKDNIKALINEGRCVRFSDDSCNLHSCFLN